MSFDYKKFCDILKEQKINSMLDIGANRGEWAQTIRNFNPNLKITCIEANEKCETFLREKNLEYFIQPLSSEVKEVKFYTNRNNDTCTGFSYYLEKTNHYDENSYVIKKCTTLDSLLKGRIFEAIKLDTQGSELDILSGGLTILNFAKLICIETSIKEYNKDSPLVDEVLKFLDKNGWYFYDKIGTGVVNGVLVQEDYIFLRKKTA